MTNATRRRKALGASSIAAAALLSACTTTENGKLMEADMNPTRPQAQAKVIEYLTDAIAVLPPGAYLTRYSELNQSHPQFGWHRPVQRQHSVEGHIRGLRRDVLPHLN